MERHLFTRHISITPSFRRLLETTAIVGLSLLSTNEAFAACGPTDPLCAQQNGELPSSFGGPPGSLLKATIAPPSSEGALQWRQGPVTPAASQRRAPPNTERATIPASSAAGCTPAKGVAEPAFSITFDGKPIDGSPASNKADSQFCTDQALRRADVQVRYDGLSNAPSLNVVASPDAVNKGAPVTFATHTNYALRLARGEIRVFDKDASTLSPPLAVLPIEGETVKWAPPKNLGDRVTYVFRVYDKEGRFDETAPKQLDLAQVNGGTNAEIDPVALADGNNRKVRNIPVSGGSILVSGKNVPDGHSVTVMGLPAKVDPQGNFAVRQILPSGDHDVEVAIADRKGAATVFSRGATIPKHDFFYVGLADLTVGSNAVRGPVGLLNPDQADNYKDKYYVDGRVAFYLKGKVKGETLITASMDTRNQPIRRMFSNFDSKDPTYLLRNLDPNRYYPVYGDDSTLVEDAPTRGKFYVRVENGESSVMWGNFKTTITGTEYVRYDRGLYGARAATKTEDSTKFGERRGSLEVFAAEPGTLGVRDVFRGTGGSLYYLSRQNITQGSERITIEVRDAATGLVLSSRTAVQNQDYEVNYLQGRITLKSTLSSTGPSDFIVQAGSLSGAQQYLVINYEYAPGLTPTRDRVIGGRASYWLSDYFQVGVTGYNQAAAGEKLTIGGADVVMRLSPLSYVKMEIARSNGPGSGENVSFDGGFSFSNRATTGAPAFARRIEAALDYSEIIPGAVGKLTGYFKQKDRDYSGPGELAIGRASREAGLTTSVKLNDQWSARAKFVNKSDEFRDYKAGEVNLAWAFADHWRITGGLRIDDNRVNSITASPDLNLPGRRVDAALRLDYISGRDWGFYGFGQITVERTGQRLPNNRIGVGGYTRFNERLAGSAEISHGDGGIGAKVGVEYKSDDDRTAYVNYALDPDRTDIMERGGLGLLTSGVRRRFDDTFSVFGEERWRYGGGFGGMMHAYGLDWSINKEWKTGLRVETGKLTDPIAGTLQRTAISPNLTYTREGFTWAGRYEYRHDATTSVGLLNPGASKRDTWLMNNLLTVKVIPDWRMIARLNGSYSTSNQGDFYRGNYLEAVLGFAYRPVANDKLNMLFKYTYFYDLPSPGQRVGVGGVGDYSQQSHILSVDGIYDLNSYLSLGGKYAIRTGSLRDNIANGPWHASTTQLLIGRLDVHVVKQWDVTAELRRLSVLGADSQTGALVGVYRHVNDNFKLGVGYNFTKFSDDLTNLGSRYRGAFVNAIGMF